MCIYIYVYIYNLCVTMHHPKMFPNKNLVGVSSYDSYVSWFSSTYSTGL